MKSHKERIIIVTPGDSFFTGPQVRAFTKLGYECVTFNSRSGIMYGNQYMRKLARVLPWVNIFKKNSIAKMNDELIAMVKEVKPKLLFVIKGESIRPESIEAIKKLNVITVNFYNDLMNQWGTISRIAPVYDLFFNQCHVVLRRLWTELGLKNCFYMAHSTEPLPESVLSRDRQYGVSFIGTYNRELYPNREKYLMAVADLGLHIWGTDGWAKTPLKPCFCGRSEGDQRFDIYAKSKIVIDVNWDLWPAEGLSNRPFEVTGCGALFMTDRTRKDITNAFQENKEVVLFENEKELREKIVYYLERDTEREAIARMGYERTLADHTYMNRARQIFDTIENPEKYLYKGV